jgi:response regulator RpfG family c-di-GMP phosphodiesterase
MIERIKMNKQQQNKTNKTILLIDDDTDILLSLGMLLEMEGYSVVSSTDSQILKKLNGSLSVQLIILDVLLSGEDGRDVCGKIKSNPVTSKIPVFLISAIPQSQNNLNICNYDEFIYKPFDPQFLLDKVEEYI